MAERNFSGIKKVVKTIQIPLPATFISNEISSISGILDNMKRQYSKQLQGVVVNYKHLSILSPFGFVIPNKPFVYYYIKATFDLFCPKIGDIVKGKIIRISKEHIVCLIENTINVSIRLFRDSPKELAALIVFYPDILFETSSFKFDSKMVLSVKGKITQKCINLMKELFPPETFSHLVDAPELSNNTDEGIGTNSESADGLQNHAFDASEIDDDGKFKKPYSNLKKKSSKSHESDPESSCVGVLNDFQSLYNEGLFSDLELHTSSKTFPVHRSILSARSPVFRRMLINDMKEKNSGQVNITDIDDATIHRMLLYIYSDSIEDMQFESAYKLFSAADKYQILALKSRCASFLKQNLNPSNTCDALDLADLYNEEDLKNCVEDYILRQRKEFFCSQEWEDLMQTHPKFSADLMHRKMTNMNLPRKRKSEE